MDVQIPGRSATVQVVTDLLAAWQKGTGGLLFVTGEPGMGKTHLARATADEARRHVQIGAKLIRRTSLSRVAPRNRQACS